jgi:hypothetical protein
MFLKSKPAIKAGGAETPSESEENLIFSNETEFVSETTGGHTKNRTWDSPAL